jgi:hypothetical protein
MHQPLLSQCREGAVSGYQIALIIAIFFVSPLAMAIEEPSFKVITKSGTFELRQYAPMLVAETMVDGDMDDAGTTGFRRIADYIFGNNQVQTGASSAKIAMTAPVTMEPQSQKIAMTAPVALMPAESMGASKQWRVHFVMPAQYNLNTIPKPKNSEVKLREIPGKLFAVNSFTGFNTQSRIQAKSDDFAAAFAVKTDCFEIGTYPATRHIGALEFPLQHRFAIPEASEISIDSFLLADRQRKNITSESEVIIRCAIHIAIPAATINQFGTAISVDLSRFAPQ